MTDPNLRATSCRVAVAAFLVLSATACGSGTPKSAPPPTARPATVEQIAAKLGCTPEMRGKAADYRQAICKAPSGNYVINTFVTDKNQKDWLDYSSMYGGTYLIGPRWIVVATPRQLNPLRQELGGRIQPGKTYR